MSTMRPLSLVSIINRPLMSDGVKPIIRPVSGVLSHRTGTITGLSGFEIAAVLGFAPNGDPVEGVARWCWNFTLNGQPCSVWDYKQMDRPIPSRWSCFGPRDLLARVFGERNVQP